MKKRILAILLIATMLLSAIPVHATDVTDAPAFVVDTVTAAAGETVDVTISVKNNPGITSIKLKVEYDAENLVLNGVEFNTDEIGGRASNVNLAKNPVTLNWFEGLEDVNGDWVFATLNFTVAETAVPGEYPFTITYNPDDVYNLAEENLAFDIIDGGITVECLHTDKVEVPAKSPDCEDAGNNLYYTCACGMVFKADGVTETTVEAETIPATGHDYADATCDTPKTCKTCGATDGDARGHSFTNYVSNNDATCTEDGTKTAQCDRCEETSTVTDEGSAKGHDYADATCDTPKTCKTCGATEGDALGHDYADAWSKGEDGHWHECTRCGAKTDFAAHDYGTEGDNCVECGFERAHVHRLTLVPAVAATCMEAGSEAYYTCAGCENWFEDASGSVVIADKASVAIAALGHDLSEANCTEAAKCQREGCDYVEGTAKGHDYADATCDTPKTCKECGVTEGEAVGHSFTNYVSNNDATCTENGTKTAKCDRCDETDTIVDEGTAKGHDYADATCDTPKTCKECGVTEGDALGHSFTNYVSNEDATCEEDGTKTAKCDRCDVTDTVVDEGTALGHSYAEAWSAGEEGHWHECATCHDKADFAEHDFGTEGDVCLVCAYERAHVHRLTLVPAVEATCTTEGTKAYYTCSGCDNWFEDAAGTILIEDKASVKTEKAPHAYEETVVEATCTTEGSVTYTCSCGDTYTETIPVKDHAFENGVCPDCGAEDPNYEEEVPSTKPNLKDWIKDWLKHWWGNKDEEETECEHSYVDEVKAPTCTEKGYTKHTCEKCGDSYTDSYVDATGHNYVKNICTECGHKKIGWIFWLDWFWKK